MKTKLEQMFIDMIKEISTNTEHKEWDVPVSGIKQDLANSIATLYYADYRLEFSLEYLTTEEYDNIENREDETDMVAEKMVEKYFNMEGWK